MDNDAYFGGWEKREQGKFFLVAAFFIESDSVKQEVIQEVIQPTYLRFPFSHFLLGKLMPRKVKSFTK